MLRRNVIARATIKETELYAAVKTFFTDLGYEVKGEIGACDAVAIRDEELIIVEFKTELNLTVLLQGVDRYAVSDHIYIAVPRDLSVVRKQRKRVIKLMRLLGMGLLAVDVKASVGCVDVLSEPGPYQARKRTRRRARLLAEFHERQGDPNRGGHSMRDGGVVTAYRQKAEAVAQLLANEGVLAPKTIRDTLAEPKASAIVRDNHYGWFERVDRGKYRLSDSGHEYWAKLSKITDDSETH